jgi:nickel transport protein
MKKYILSITLLLITLTPIHMAYAHRVIFFAWLENGYIHAEGSFPGKKKAQNCKIIVSDEQNRIIHEGITDEQGFYSFKIPDGVDSDLILTLKAGEGHQGEWRITKAELTEHSSSEITEKAEESDRERAEKKVESNAPSTLKIIAGIALIFFLAGMAKLLLRKKKA